MRPRILIYVAATFVANVALAQPVGDPPAGHPAPAAGGSSQPDVRQKGQAVLEGACASCHAIDLTTSQRHSRDEWTDVVSRMVGNGAQLSDDDYNLLIEYLAKQYGPSGSPAPAG